MNRLSQDERCAMLAWEASVERLRHALLPPDGLPLRTSQEINECFTLTEQNLAALREAYLKRPTK